MTEAAPITRASIDGSPQTMIDHDLVGSTGFWADWRCDRYPRLVRHYHRGSRTAPAVIAYSVDGVRCADLDEAVRRLNGPVVAEDAFEVAS